MLLFTRYIGIDYSGARTPTSSLRSLRVYQVTCDAPPSEVLPPPSPRKYWTRRGIAEWLVEQFTDNEPTLVSVDHSFSVPGSHTAFLNPDLTARERHVAGAEGWILGVA